MRSALMVPLRRLSLSVWDKNVFRGQAVALTPLFLTKGRHTLTIRALDEHVVIDQWMIDFKPDRQFYVFPTDMTPMI